MATKDPKEQLKSAKEKIAEQRKMKDDLSGALLAGRLAAKTETRVKVPAAEIDKAAKVQKALIPPPQKTPAPPQKRPAPAPVKQKVAPPQQKPKVAAKKGTKRVAWDPKKLIKFVAGVITLGELEGITKKQQHEMAKLGHRFIRQGKLKEAKAVFEGLLALDPHDAYFHLALGSIAQREDDLDEAEERYTRALEINPYSPHALANRGEVLMMKGRMLDGAKDLLRALEEDPKCREEATKRARATIGVVLQQLKAAGVEVGEKKKAPGPTKKTGIAAPPGMKPAPRAAKPMPRPRPRPLPKK
jgi:tetratricopeptide (TPR) repeat protein